MRSLYVYIMSSKSRVLYVGVTNSLERRYWEHVLKVNGRSFTSQYNIGCLVYFEEVLGPMNAILREKQIKKWSRKKKIALIMEENPEFKNLAIELGFEKPPW